MRLRCLDSFETLENGRQKNFQAQMWQKICEKPDKELKKNKQ